jgi:hypothetical protein
MINHASGQAMKIATWVPGFPDGWGERIFDQKVSVKNGSGL